MSYPLDGKLRKFALVPLGAAALLAAGCSSNLTGMAGSAVTAPAFVVGTDAPMAAVTSFQAQLVSVDAIDASGNAVSLISGSPTVDFARFNGLQTLLDLNDVPVGTYTAVKIVLGSNATLGYLVTGSGAPTIQTEAATLTTNTVTVTLANPLVIAQSGPPMGLRVDFNLAKSIQVDANGNITGTVTPTFEVKTVGEGDSDAHIDEYTAGVLSVNAAGQSFVVQGPHGEQLTVIVNGQTEWDGGATIGDLTTSSIVQVSGHLDPANQTLDAGEVDIISQHGFFASGQVTYVTPATGAATSFDLYVRSLEPAAGTGITLGQIATVDLSGSENFEVFRMHNDLTQFLFNASAIVPGQSIAVGGQASGAANASAVSVTRVSLRPWGFNGTVVPNSVNSSQGTFQLQINGFAGVLVPQPVTVYIGSDAEYRDGLTDFSEIGANANIRVVGLLLRDPTSGNLVLLARYVDQMN